MDDSAVISERDSWLTKYNDFIVSAVLGTLSQTTLEDRRYETYLVHIFMQHVKEGVCSSAQNWPSSHL